ncbi:MAG: hypothetical protein Q9172_007127 [Xanthocarpia lactea]
MSGAQEGLLGLVQNSVTGREPDGPRVDRKQTNPMPLGDQAFEEDSLQTSPPYVDNTPSEVLEPPVVPIEPSFATEGVLWFPDLLAPDPHLFLPFILSLTLFANIIHVEKTANKLGTAQTAFRRRLGNSFKIVALAVGPMTLSMPSAIHVYWISSSVFAMGYNMLMNWYSPLVTGVKPCRERRLERSLVVNEARQTLRAQKTRERRDRKEKEKDEARRNVS